MFDHVMKGKEMNAKTKSLNEAQIVFALKAQQPRLMNGGGGGDCSQIKMWGDMVREFGHALYPDIKQWERRHAFYVKCGWRIV